VRSEGAAAADHGTGGSAEARREAMSGYTFGDSDLAARRLALVAATFARTTRQFLLTRAGAAPRFAVDLGCGPGFTTELIRATVGPARILGVDISPAFVAAAAKRLADDRTRLLCADVLDLPLEVTDADLIFARMLLTHLRDPLAAIDVWRGRLAERGVLLLEEVDSIATDDATLAGYLDLQREMLAANGNALDIGPQLDEGLAREPGAARQRDRRARRAGPGRGAHVRDELRGLARAPRGRRRPRARGAERHRDIPGAPRPRRGPGAPAHLAPAPPRPHPRPAGSSRLMGRKVLI
jgi:SAM-dependent methyltransferase